MIRDLLFDKPETAERSPAADVCIVGAGAAGIVLALELLRLGRTVVMLEGGGATIEEESQETYRSDVAGVPHHGIHTGRFRAIGGTTTRWGGQILELDAHDFEARPWILQSGWPIKKRVLTPHYERALALEGIEKVSRDDSVVWREIGLEQPRFGTVQQYFTRWCPQPNFALLHRDTLQNSRGLVIWQHANAVAMDFSGETATGIRARTLTGIAAVFRAKVYVFCMGTIESSRFFLQPYEGGVPWNRSGLLGKHFQDHIDCNAATVEPLDAPRFHAGFDNVYSRGFKYHPKLRLSPAKQAENRTLNVAGTMNFVSAVDETLAKIKATARLLLRGQVGEIAASDLRAIAASLPLLARQVGRYAVQNRAFNPPDSVVLLRVHCEQRPDSESSITLSTDRDRLGMLRTRLDWRISTLEVESIRQYVTSVQQALAGIARVEPDAELMRPDPAFLAPTLLAKCDDSNHHMGGMRMAAAATEGLVDTNLRLYGMRNVYVSSAAVFPTSGHSNPTHTLLALAVRLAEHLAAIL